MGSSGGIGLTSRWAAWVRAALVAWVLLVPEAVAAAEVLTRARVVALSRLAPTVRTASAEVGVARAEREAAGVFSLSNPVLSAAGGLRVNADGRVPVAAAASLSFPFDLGGQRAARVDAAGGALKAAEALGADTGRKMLLAVLLQHAQVLRDERELGLARMRRELAQGLLTTVERRRAAGEIRETDAALATLQASREAAAAVTAEGARDADLAVLVALLGIADEAPTVSGQLLPENDPPALAVLLREAEARTDVRAAQAQAVSARARVGREEAAKWSSLSVSAQYELDEGAHIGMVGVSAPLPLLNANRAAVAAARAEVEVADARLAVARTGAAGQIRQLHARYTSTRAALEALGATAELAKRASALAQRSFELGESDTYSALLVRREALDAQLALLAAEHAHANAKIELLVLSGRVPR
ncbi:Heavy metal RND efflux outer membrane protein, CzcC family [Chondromyces apiculatus DSM 436]|uniref:Heavy metal RND efflux outer membrane protein, CzcC family n=1 Tax=Chondromyces apiculatus DSM 436 TaxID=1192034 RepID=A0A017TDX1_9BACT|nr:Heavy metal RND efflux outer membrane protein, CzcC family [Chondromyces apiculatus DSM 436]